MATRPSSAVNPASELRLSDPAVAKGDASTMMMYPETSLGNIQTPELTFSGISKYGSILLRFDRDSPMDEFVRELEATVRKQIKAFGWDKSYKSVLMESANDATVALRLKVDAQTTFWHADRTGMDRDEVTDTAEAKHRFRGFVVFRAPYVWRKPASSSLTLCAVNVVVAETLDSESLGPAECVFL